MCRLFFEQRIRGKGISVNSRELLTSETDSAEIEDMLESTLRLADGGGQMPHAGRVKF